MSSTNPPGQGRDDGDRPDSTPWTDDPSGAGDYQDPGSSTGSPQYGSPGAYQTPQYGSPGAYQPPQHGGDQGDYRGPTAPQYDGGQQQSSYQQPGQQQSSYQQQGSYQQQPGYQQPGYGSSYGAPGQYGPGGPQPRNGMGIAALVVGIVSLLVAWVPFLGLISVLGGVVGIVLGAIALKRVGRGEATNKGQSIAGIVVSVVAILLAIAATTLFTSWFATQMPELFGPEFQECVETSGGSQEELEQCLQEEGVL